MRRTKPQPSPETPAKPTGHKLADLARRLKIDPGAASRAARDGRFGAAVRYEGRRWVVLDLDQAAANFEASRRPQATDGGRAGAGDYQVARARRESAQAELAERELAEHKGDLVSVREIRAEVVGKYRVVRTKFLGLAARCKQRLPHLSAGDVRLIDETVREFLEELADGRAPS